MSLFRRRQEVARVECRLRSECAVLLLQTREWRRIFHRHRAGWLIGGGIGAGTLAGLLPLHGALRMGTLLVRLAGFALRPPMRALERAVHATRLRP